MSINQEEIMDTPSLFVELTEAFLATHRYNQCAADAFYYMGLILVTPIFNQQTL